MWYRGSIVFANSNGQMPNTQLKIPNAKCQLLKCRNVLLPTANCQLPKCLIAQLPNCPNVQMSYCQLSIAQMSNCLNAYINKCQLFEHFEHPIAIKKK